MTIRCRFQVFQVSQVSQVSTTFLLASLALGGAVACSSSDAKGDGASAAGTDAGASDAGGSLAIGQKAPWPTTEWTVVAPEDMGMDSATLEAAKTYALDPDQNTQGVVVVRGGAIVAEWYGPGADASTVAASWSMGKSFASALIGVLKDEGKITDLDAPMSTWIPEWAGTTKGSIPLRSVLHMQSGLKWAEDYAAAALSQSDIIQIGVTGDAFDYMINKVNVGSAPDTRWYYSSGDSELLSIVIQKLTGKSATDYGREKLFDRIGMSPVDWWVDGKNQTLTFCCVDTPTRQFAKFGLLYLRGGAWDGKQIVSQAWVKESTSTPASQNPGYAYQWWMSEPNADNPLPKDMFMAEGYDGQRIYVIPSLDLVVAKNTVYNKPPGDAVATGGYLSKFAPSGIGKYGTLASKLWEDAPFLAPIINSIKGAPQITAVATKLDSPNDPVLCKQKAQNYGTYCDAMQGCICDTCAKKFLDCDKEAGCAAVMQCGVANACRGIACATPCADVIQANGGVGSTAVTLALDLSNCATPCPTTCP